MLFTGLENFRSPRRHVANIERLTQKATCWHITPSSRFPVEIEAYYSVKGEQPSPS